MILRLVLFLLTFTLEVHVYAASVPIQEPRGCLQTKDVCALENADERGFEFEIDGATVTLDRDSAVIRKSPGEIRIVRGTAWVHAHAKPFLVSSEFGGVRSVGEGDFWVTKSTSELTAMAVSTDVELSPRGSQETLTVTQGLQNTLGKVGFDGQASTGLPMPIPFKDHVLRWGRLYKGPKAEFEAQVDRFHAKWQEAAQESAAINKAVFDRKIAAVEEAARIEAEKKAKVEAENRALREMFRRRNGL
jgi:hypothetical protein